MRHQFDQQLSRKLPFQSFSANTLKKVRTAGKFSSSGPAPPFRPHLEQLALDRIADIKKVNISFRKLCKNICGTKQIYVTQNANLLPIIKVGYKTSCRHNCLIYLQKTKGTLLVGSKVVCTCTEWFSSEGCRPYLPSFPAAPARQLR